MASEMLYPVMPMYLKEIGFSVLLIGVLEGVAEAVAGLSKSYFGKWSDHTKARVPFVRIGYLLSALSKPMMAVFSFPVWVFLARTIDRIGKGIRTGARDALLSAETNQQHKAKVFGFHRSMDTFGAVAGPLMALLFLYFFPSQYRTLFFIAFVPGLAAILLTYFLKENKDPSAKTNPRSISFFAFKDYWKQSSPAYKKLLVGLLIFTLFNSSDVFLLLKMKENGSSDYTVILIYIFYNLIYALAAYPIGIIADKAGLMKTFITGLFLFALVYAGFAINTAEYIFYLLFFIYGIYAAATESIAKAWISNIVKKEETATAIGTYTGFQSICTMLASSVAGLIWFQFGAAITFLLTAAITILVLIYFLLFVKEPSSSHTA